MATSHLRGDATIIYTPPDDTETVHLLALPFRDIRPIDRGRRHEWWADDLDTREIVTIGDGVSDAWVTIRAENQPVALKRLLRLALRHDLTLTYTEADAEFPFRLVAVEGASDLDETPLEPDRERHGYGEWECRIHIRALASATLDGIYSSES